MPEAAGRGRISGLTRSLAARLGLVAVAFATVPVVLYGQFSAAEVAKHWQDQVALSQQIAALENEMQPLADQRVAAVEQLKQAEDKYYALFDGEKIDLDALGKADLARLQAKKALLDVDQPWKVIARCNQALLNPEAPYELTGFVPGVCVPVGCLCDTATGRIAIYYGAADTVSALCFCQAQEIVEFVKEYSL